MHKQEDLTKFTFPYRKTNIRFSFLRRNFWSTSRCTYFVAGSSWFRFSRPNILTNLSLLRSLTDDDDDDDDNNNNNNVKLAPSLSATTWRRIVRMEVTLLSTVWIWAVNFKEKISGNILTDLWTPKPIWSWSWRSKYLPCRESNLILLSCGRLQ
jgi:hypothetical protein